MEPGRRTRVERDPLVYEPGRDVALEQVEDQGERLLRSMSEASGFRQTTCPWRAMRDPFVAAVLDAHKDWTAGSLVASWPELPYALRCGILEYDRALNAVQVHDFRAEQAKREQEQAQRASAGWSGSRPMQRRGPQR